jgi:hypothetical protein
MAVFRREKFLQLQSQRWCEMKLAGDWLLWIDMANNSRVVELQDYLNYFRVYESNTTNRFRKQGFDIIEGLKVFKHGIELVNNDYSKYKLYLHWTKIYFHYSPFFVKGVKPRVLKEYIKFDSLFLIYFGYKFIRNQITKIYYFLFR